MESCTNRNLLKKICNVAIEVAGSLKDIEDVVWQEIFKLIFAFLQTGDPVKTEAALNTLQGLFQYLIDHIVKFKSDLLEIFKGTLVNTNLDIAKVALESVSQFIQMAEAKDTKEFQPLVPLMIGVIERALKESEETVLEDCLLEFNDMAEIEPKFFKTNLKNMFSPLLGIVDMDKNDFTKQSIRQQPVEFFVTMAERLPGAFKKEGGMLQTLLEKVFKLMIDIDDDIDEDWLRPKEGYQVDKDGEEEDNVNFGKTCVDRLVAAIGDEKMLPMLADIVNKTLQVDDWKYKHAGLMAFSQVGEYIDEIDKISSMIPIVINLFQH